MKTNQEQFRQALGDAFKQGMLSEGLLDNVLSFLTNLQATWDDAASSAETKELNVPERLEPTQSAEDQLHAVVCVCQAVGYSIREVLENIDYFEEIREDISEEMMDTPGESIPVMQNLLNIVIRFAGNASGYLKNERLESCSQKVYNIGRNINPGANSANTLENLIEAFQDIESLQIRREIEDVINSDAAKVMLEEDPYWSSRGKEFIDQGVKALNQISEAIDRLKEIIPHVREIEAFIEETAKSPDIAGKEVVLVQAPVFESASLVRVYKNVCKEILRGS